MADPYRDLSKREQQRAEERAKDARLLAAAVIGATLAKVAMVAVDSATRRDLGSALRDLRVAVQAERNADARRAEAQALRSITSAMSDGYRFDAAERAKIAAVEVAVVEPSLSDFPIGPYTAAELAMTLRRRFEQAIDTTLTLPLSGALPVAAIPAALGQVAAQHAERVGAAVIEAVHAGAKAAAIDLGKALIGEPGPITVRVTAPPVPPGAKAAEGDVWFQYHTQHDNRVRPSHAALDGTVWRVDDIKAPVPPLDWNCRCFTSFCSPDKMSKLPGPQDPKAGTAADKVLGGTPRPVARTAVYAAYMDEHVPSWRGIMERVAKSNPVDQLVKAISELRATGLSAADAHEYATMLLAVLRD